jgi:hypothetical protein
MVEATETAMAEKPNFILVPDNAPPAAPPPRQRGTGVLARLKALATDAASS